MEKLMRTLQPGPLDIREALARPLPVALAAGKPILIKIDAIVFANGICALGGWHSAPLAFEVLKQGEKVSLVCSDSFIRPDVNQFLGAATDASHGFALSFACNAESALVLRAGGREFVFQPGDFAVAQGIGVDTEHILGQKVSASVRSRAAPQACPDPLLVRGGLDHALRWPDVDLRSPVLVAGWFAAPHGARLLFGDAQEVFAAQILYFARDDIFRDFDILLGKNARVTGFVAVISACPAQACKIGVYVDNGGSRTKLAELEITDFFRFRSFIRAIFSLSFPTADLPELYSGLFAPLLTAIQRKRIASINSRQCICHEVGKRPEQPLASVIVPLYGSLEFLAEQLQCFAWDQAFQAGAELIYVIADPALADPFRTDILPLATKYGISCSGLYAQAELGFAEACNLGAKMARGSQIVFLNSDVFPVRPGWISQFPEFFRLQPQAGILGVRLEYEGGAPQHCGAFLVKHQSLDIWECRHFLEDSEPGPRRISYVTGACIAVRKADFQALGGFDTDYLVGNFEDLDLCDRARAQGMEVWYLPEIVMRHKWHQTFKKLEDGKWLERLWIYNAVLFARNPERQALTDPARQTLSTRLLDMKKDGEHEDCLRQLSGYGQP